MEALALCNEDDLKDGGLPLGPRKKLMKYLEDRTRARNGDTISGLEKFQQQSIESEVKYIFGPAGTGQPSVTYPVILKRVLSVLFIFKKIWPILGPFVSFHPSPIPTSNTVSISTVEIEKSIDVIRTH